MDLSQLFEEEIVVGHGVEDAGGGEDDAVGGAEGGDKDGAGYGASGPRAEDRGCCGGGDGFAVGGSCGAEGVEIGDYRDEIQTRERERAEQEGAGESFLRIDDFSGAVGAELPPFVGPEDG